MAKYISNAFSLQMIQPGWVICTKEITPVDVPVDAVSIIGHADTAAVISGILNRKVEMNRTSIQLKIGDELYVAQITGGRLPEGATTLPEGIEIKWVKVVPQSLDNWGYCHEGQCPLSNLAI